MITIMTKKMEIAPGNSSLVGGLILHANTQILMDYITLEVKCPQTGRVLTFLDGQGFIGLGQGDDSLTFTEMKVRRKL